jgi:hypothetical protein
LTEEEQHRLIAELEAYLEELREDDKTIQRQLAPVKARRHGLEQEIKGTYRHHDFEDEETGKRHRRVLGFAGEVRTVESNRIQSFRFVDGKKEFEYGLQPVAVRISDPIKAARRRNLFVEMTRLDEVYGPQFEKSRLVKAAIKEAGKAIKRLLKVKIDPPPRQGSLL